MKELLTILLFTTIAAHAEVRVIHQLEPLKRAFESCGQGAVALIDGEQVNSFSSVISLAKENSVWLIAFSNDSCHEDLTKFDQIIKTDAFYYGLSLEEYFEILTIYPREVIFVDTREDRVQSIHTICARRNITCTAFHLIIP